MTCYRNFSSLGLLFTIRHWHQSLTEFSLTAVLYPIVPWSILHCSLPEMGEGLAGLGTVSVRE